MGVPHYRSETVAPDIAEWFDVAAAVVSAIGAEDFLERVTRHLERLVSFEFVLIYLYRDGAAPAQLLDDGLSDEARRGLRNYLEFTYVLNPVYQAFKNGVRPGVCFMRDITPDGYAAYIRERNLKIRKDERETIGYLTHGWPSGMEELLMLLDLGDGALVEISMSRRIGYRLPDDVLPGLKLVFPVFEAAFRKHWESMQASIAPEAESPTLDDALENFGASTLTPREQEVVRLILMGHSTYSIASRLGTSIPTVKSHRRNSYMKLNITSQAELFALFITSIESGRGEGSFHPLG